MRRIPLAGPLALAGTLVSWVPIPAQSADPAFRIQAMDAAVQSETVAVVDLNTRHVIDDGWSAAHASTVAHINGDGRPDFVTGKRAQIHSDATAAERDRLGMYWYDLALPKPGSTAPRTRHVIDEGGKIGGGLQIPVTDIDADGDLDVVTSGKTGLYLAENMMKSPQSSPSYQVTHTFPVGGDGSWDYVIPDPPQHRVFIGRQNRVMVVDANDGKLVGEVTGINGAHGVAVASRSGHGFATSGNDGTVVMFDLNTFKTLATIPAAEDADAVIYDPASNRVFTFNGDAHSSTVIDPDAGKLVANIPLGGKPEYGVSAGDGKVYANLTDTSEVIEVDAKALKVIRKWSTAPCKQPVAMAIDVKHHRLLSGCRSGVLAVSDYDAGKVVATVPIGQGVDGAGYDSATADAFATNADGTLTVIHQDDADTYHVVETVKTPTGSRNLGLDQTTHRVFVPSATFAPAAAATPDNPRPRPTVVPGSFALLVIERASAAR